MKLQEQVISVRLFLFSGRPDPEWSLDETAVGQLRERVQKTVGGEKIRPAAPGGLGYRGFLVQNRANVAGLPAEFTVFRGVLSEPSGPTAIHWRDLRGVEDWLLAQARERGFGKALDSFGVGAGGPEQHR